MPKKSTGLPVHRSYRPDAQEKEKEKDKKKKKKKKKVQINEEERDEEPDEREQEAEFSFNDLDDGEHERNVDPNDPPLPVYGFGSTRYGILGEVDEKCLQPAQADDYFERFTYQPQQIEGLCGKSAHAIAAGESHFCLLIDYQPIKGGLILAQGLATRGRLGIGGARKEMTRRQMMSRRRERSHDHLHDDDGADDFMSLPFEHVKLPNGVVIEDKNARYLARPKVARCEHATQVSCGQCHNACVTEEGRVYVWGSNRHGRLGYVTLNVLPFDKEDENDCYVSAPVALDFPGGKVKYISCGLKHTVACDERGQVWAWGLARYGRLGTGEFEELPKEPPDVHGFVDEMSHHQPYPMAVKGLATIYVSKVFAGAYNSFALAGGSHGSPTTIYVWGLARYGLLGVGDYPTQCCYERLVDPTVPADQCPSCKRTAVERVPGITSYEEEQRGHAAFSRCQVTKPRETQTLTHLPSDPEDPMDTYIPYPVEVTKFQAQNVVHVYPGYFHVLALTDDGKVFGWGLLRHGRCGIGKFDPNSAWSDDLQRNVVDKQCPTYPREKIFQVTSKGVVRASVQDETSWELFARYEASPVLLDGLKAHQVVDVSVAECHGAAVTVDGRVFTWGVGRHGRLGLSATDVEFLLDPEDPDGAYVASPTEVPSVKDHKICKVACTATSTLLVGSQLLDGTRARSRRRSSLFGRRNSAGTASLAADPNPVFRLIDVGATLVSKFKKKSDDEDTPKNERGSSTCVLM